MSYHQKYLRLREELWEQFAALVQVGASFPELIDVTYPHGVNPAHLPVDTEGRSWIQARSINSQPGYVLHRGEDLIIGTNPVTFVDTEGKPHQIEPDSLDIYWLSTLLDAAVHRAVEPAAAGRH